MPIELVLETLYRDGEHDKLIWKWRPLPAPKATSASTSAGVTR